MASEAQKVFISYNQADRDWAAWIAAALERAGYRPIIQAWDFRPGENFVLRMQRATAEADIAIPLLSEDYLKSEYTQPEWAAAFAQDPTGEKRRLIPVRVTNCILTGMLAPIIYIDLVGLREQDAERALVEGLKPSGRPIQPPRYPCECLAPGVSAAPFPPNVARLYGVPELPPHYLPRELDIGGLKQKLIGGNENVGITGQSSRVGVHGMGGIGKTVLAVALAHDPSVREAFPQGIFWLTVGQAPDHLALQSQLLGQLTGSRTAFVTAQEGKDAMREALVGRRILLVLDDVWTIEDADAFWVDAPPARLLITTRNEEVLVGLGAEEHRVHILSPSDALKVLAEWVGEKNTDKLPSEATEVAKECGYLPLALAMIGAMIRLRPTAWKDALDRLRRADLEAIKRNFPGYPYPDLLRAIQVGTEALDDPDRERYLDLAVFPEEQPIPAGELGALWRLSPVDTRDCMTRFVARSLATWVYGESALLLHDLQHDLIRKRRVKDLPGLHLRLLETWDAMPKLPHDYAWRWIAYHLAEAGQKNDLRRLLLDFGYLRAKLGATDPNRLIADYDYFPEDINLRLVQSAIRLSAHLLFRDKRQLASQLTGRLLGDAIADIQALLAQMLEQSPHSWLRPVRANLNQPGGSLLRTLEDRARSFSAVGATSDGRLAVSGSYDNTLRVWDLESGQILHTLEGHEGPVRAVVVLPNGRAISGSEDGTLRLWDLESGQTLRTLKVHSALTAMAVTPDGRHAVSASEDRRLRLWDLESSRLLRTLEGHTASITAVAVTPDGRHAVAASFDRKLRLWDLENGRILRSFEGHTGSITTVAVTPDGRRAVSTSEDHTLRLWNLEKGQELCALKGHNDWVTTVAVLPDGRRAVSASEDRTLRLWDLDSGETLRTFEGHTAAVTAVVVTANDRAISASFDRTLRLWDLKHGQELASFEGHEGSVTAVAVTPEGRAVSASFDGKLRLWDLENGQILRTFEGHTGPVRAVAVMPDGRRAVSASFDRTLRLWDLKNGRLLRTLEGHSAITAVAVTPDGSGAVSASLDRTLQLWNLESGQIVRTLECQSAATAVAVTASGCHALLIPGGAAPRLWDLQTGQTLPALKSTGPVYALAVTSDGRYAASDSLDGTLRLWSLESGQIYTLENPPEVHAARVKAVSVTPDGHRAVSASEDGTLRLWDVDRGKEIATFTGESPMRSCAISPDGQTIVGGEDSGRLHFLRLVEPQSTKIPIGEKRIQLLHRE